MILDTSKPYINNDEHLKSTLNSPAESNFESVKEFSSLNSPTEDSDNSSLSDSNEKPVKNKNESNNDVNQILESEVLSNKESTGLESQENDFVNRPRNMSLLRKYIITCLLTSCAFQVTCLSTVWSQAIADVSAEHSINKTIATLGVTLFICGQGVGPLMFSPISEMYGRRPVYLVGLSLYCSFQLLTCFGPHLALMLVGRFFSGFSGGIFITVISGTFSDLFEQKDMGIPTLMFSIAPFLGPGIGPVIGGVVNESLGYRWIFIVMLIWSCLLLILVALIVPETYRPVLIERLQNKANDSSQSILNGFSMLSIFKTTLSLIMSAKKPLTMLVTKPIIFFTSLISGIFLAIIYLFFVAYPLIFETMYNFTPMNTSFTYLGITTGMICTIPTRGVWLKLAAKLKKKNNDISVPEHRLPQMLAGIIIAFVGLLIFAFTIRPSIHFMVPIMASSIFGFGCLYVFNTVFTYVFECFPTSTASASACNLFLRSFIAGVFPLFGRKMFIRLTSRFACLVLALVILSLSIAPVMFWRLGHKMRNT